MNKALIIGRLTADPDTRSTPSGKTVSRYTLAVDRVGEGTDYISVVAWDKNATFAEKYLHKGMKIALEGRIHTSSYEKDGRKVYTTDVIAEHQEFCERKQEPAPAAPAKTGGFENIPDNIDIELPFT